MLLTMPAELAVAYQSRTQQARVVSEAWAERNLFCPCCPSDELQRQPHGTQASDFQCSRCDSWFQLKSCGTRFGSRIVDGAYAAMERAILAAKTPSLMMLEYAPQWTVRSLTFLPHFSFTLSCLEKRPPLSPKARRAGWVGCNIVLGQIPRDARIPIVAEGVISPPADVRRRFDALRPVSQLDALERGWTLDVLTVVRALGSEVFTLADVLKSADKLCELHPDNKHVPDKVRQQLQRLRDLGFLEFVDNRGTYRVLAQ